MPAVARGCRRASSSEATAHWVFACVRCAGCQCGDDTGGAVMNFDQSERSRHWFERVSRFMDEYVYPAVPVYAQQSAALDRWKDIPPIFEELKHKARAAGLWNMFMPPSEHDDEYFTSVGLTNVEYAPI